MKRMKNLLALVMAVVMVLALAIPAFAANGGTIKVAEPGTHTYQVYKVFDATKTDGEYTYELKNDALAAELLDPTNGFHDLILTKTAEATSTPPAPATYTVKKTDTFSAAEFATWLESRTDKLVEISDAYDVADPSDPTSMIKASADKMKTGYPVGDDGYYFITYDNGAPYALTTVDSGKDVQIQNKHDTPFDKDVYKAQTDRENTTPSHNEKSVQMGDTLYYQIVGKVVDVEDNTQYNYLVWDKMSKGQKLILTDAPYTNTVKVYVQPLGTDGAPTGTKTNITTRFTVDTLNTTPVTSTPKDTIWVNTTVPSDADDEVYTDTTPSFVVNIDMKGLNDYIKAADPDGLGADNLNYAIIIEYNATVLEDVGVIVNTAHLVSNDLIKDAQTQNYVSEIVVDKFETGNASQKLSGAEFVLYRDIAAQQVTIEHTFGSATDPTTLYKFKDDNGVVYWNTVAAGTGAWYDASYNNVSNNPTSTTAVTMNKAYYHKDANGVSWIPFEDAENWNKTIEALVAANPTEAPSAPGVITKVVTDSAGAGKFTGLADNEENEKYHLVEIKAPDGYVRLETPVDIVVNGKASLDPNNTVDNNPIATANNQLAQLQNVSHVANTPGSVLPSTGGRGTTMLYMAGLGMMLAAGAFLIFRRRAEAGK